jgi:broad specificity phosphatase PhoE
MLCVDTSSFQENSGIPAERGEKESMSKIIVVRHGERIDEVDARSWMSYCRENYDPKSIQFEYRINDPYLTEEGCKQAQEVAESIARELQDIDHEIPYIYCSKLVRSVQTAYYIALKISKPVVLSKGFAMTAAAVENIGDEFEYLPLEKLQELCPGVEFIDGDAEAAHAIPSQTWLHPIHHITGLHLTSLVVAHRESIRNLARARLQTPYCCYGIFDRPTTATPTIELSRLAHRDGNEIEFVPKKKKTKRMEEMERGEEVVALDFDSL